MNLEPIHFRSETVKNTLGTDWISKKISEVDGIECAWTTHDIDGFSRNLLQFSWSNYTPMVTLNGFTMRVHIYLHEESGEQLDVFNFEDFVNEERKFILTDAPTAYPNKLCLIHFEAWLTPLIKRDYSDMFQRTELTDLEIEVDGNTMHLNSEFLCHHSSVFDEVLNSVPFNLNYWNETIPFKDFVLLLRTIYPNGVHPEDDDVEKLLEMARIFKMPAVTRSVEYHLQHFTKLPADTLLDLKNRYGVEFSKTLKRIKFNENYTITKKEEMMKKHKVGGLRLNCSGSITPTGVRFDFWFKWDMENVNAFKATIKIQLFDKIHNYKPTEHTHILYKHPLRGSQFSVVLNMPKNVDSMQVKVEYVLTQYLCVRAKYERLYRSLKDTDRILKVDGKEFRVNMKFLAFHSEFFNRIFFGSVKETKEIVEIDCIGAEDFGLFLLTMHSEKEFPNDENIENLLYLADYFGVQLLIEQCERYLIHGSKLTISEKKRIADKYPWPNLLKSIEQMTNRVPDVVVLDDDDDVKIEEP